MADPEPPTKTLGRVSAHLLAELQKNGKPIFTLLEAQKITKTDYYATANLLTKLIQRGVIARVKTATYLILQAGGEKAQLKNWLVLARALAGSDPYFISYYSAMRIHGMTSHPLLDVYMTVSKRKKNRELSGMIYHFITCKPRHFWGAADHWITKQDRVQISDLERTVLDGLDRPDLCGGLMEVVRGIWGKQKEIDPKKLLRYAQRFRTKAALKRLGFILETLTMTPNLIPALRASTADAKDYILLDPQGLKEGRHVRRWRIRLNANMEELKAGVWG